MTFGISITPEEIQNARGATFLTDMTLEISPNGGHLVAVAEYKGVQVCWGCGEPFDNEEKGLRMIEMKPGGGPTPVGMHYKCCGSGRKVVVQVPSVGSVARGLRLRKLMARAVKPMLEIEQRIAGAAKKIIGVD